MNWEYPYWGAFYREWFEPEFTLKFCLPVGIVQKDSFRVHTRVSWSLLHPQFAPTRAQVRDLQRSPWKWGRFFFRELHSCILPFFLPLIGHCVQRQQRSNSSSITEFSLLILADMQDLQLLHFQLFLSICQASLLGYSLFFTAIDCSHRLHTPMDLSSTWAASPPLSAKPWPVLLGHQEHFLCFWCRMCCPGHLQFLLGYCHVIWTLWPPASLHTVGLSWAAELVAISTNSCLTGVWAIMTDVCVAFGCSLFILFSSVQIFRDVPEMPSEYGGHKASLTRPWSPSSSALLCLPTLSPPPSPFHLCTCCW